MRMIWWIIGGAAALLVVAGCAWMAAQNVEQPEYALIARDGDFELRDYPALRVAQVTRAGERVAAANDGFGPLARYIFARERDGDRIAMTAPVTQTPQGAPDGTATMLQSRDGDPGDWTIRFIMPRGYSLDALPRPASAEVTLEEIPPRRLAAVRFSGRMDDARFDTQEKALRDWIAARGLTPLGPPTYAYYNDPFTPGFLRRNEVLYEVAER